jgi:hypothetical protein
MAFQNHSDKGGEGPLCASDQSANKTYLDVLDRVPRFIEEVYNKKRPHSSLGYLSPEEFEKREGSGYQNKSTVSRPVTKL